MISTVKPTKLYELTGAEADRHFSPNCWRVRLALLHKGLPFETVPWRFTEKETIAFSGQEKVPVMTDGEQVVYDSWTIAEYLEQTYGDRPSLFGDEVGKALSRFVTEWVTTTINPVLFGIMVMDIYNHLHDKDKAYFRQSREAWLGMSLEEASGDRDQKVSLFRSNLAPLRATLKYQPFLAGQNLAWADYVVFSTFQWARCISSFPLLEADDLVFRWRERMLDAFDGHARQAKGYPC